MNWNPCLPPLATCTIFGHLRPMRTSCLSCPGRWVLVLCTFYSINNEGNQRHILYIFYLSLCWKYNQDDFGIFDSFFSTGLKNDLPTIIINNYNNNISAVKRLIVINRIQNKSFCLHNICVCVVYIYYVYINTHIYSNTQQYTIHTINIFNM